VANLVVVRTDYMGSHKGTLLAGGDKLWDVAFVASHLVCDVISGAAQRYIKLKHKDQLRLAL